MKKVDLHKPHTVDCKVELCVLDKQQLRICFSDGKKLVFVDFGSFERFAKMVYAAYKKYKYVFEEGGK